MVICELSPSEAGEEAAQQVSQLMTELAGADRSITSAALSAVAVANHLFVARQHDVIVGLICLVPMHLPQGVRLWVESVIVAPTHRQAGVGKALMESVMRKAASYGHVTVSLTSNPTRPAAHRLFESFGFSRADTSVFRRSAG